VRTSSPRLMIAARNDSVVGASDALAPSGAADDVDGAALMAAMDGLVDCGLVAGGGRPRWCDEEL
jgi:hypothetical protein